jgi:hypothetical protein
MQTRFDAGAYRNRAPAETVISMIKRHLEPCVRSRTAWTGRYELRLMVLAHDVTLLIRTHLFY